MCADRWDLSVHVVYGDDVPEFNTAMDMHKVRGDLGDSGDDVGWSNEEEWHDMYSDLA